MGWPTVASAEGTLAVIMWVVNVAALAAVVGVRDAVVARLEILSLVACETPATTVDREGRTGTDGTLGSTWGMTPAGHLGLALPFWGINYALLPHLGTDRFSCWDGWNIWTAVSVHGWALALLAVSDCQCGTCSAHDRGRRGSGVPRAWRV